MKHLEVFISVFILFCSTFVLINARNETLLASTPKSFKLKFEPNSQWAQVDQLWPKIYATNKSILSLDTDVIFRSDQPDEDETKKFFFRQQDSSSQTILQFSKNFFKKYNEKSGTIEIRFNVWTSTADVTIEANKVFIVKGNTLQWEPVRFWLEISDMPKFRMTYDTHEGLQTFVAIKDVYGKCALSSHIILMHIIYNFVSQTL